MTHICILKTKRRMKSLRIVTTLSKNIKSKLVYDKRFTKQSKKIPRNLKRQNPLNPTTRYTKHGRCFLTTSKEYIFVTSSSESYGSEMHQILIDKYNVKIHPSMYKGKPTIVYELSRIMEAELEEKRILLEQLKTVLSVFNENPKLKDENGQTPLHYAVECGNIELVDFFWDICFEYMMIKITMETRL